MKIRLNWSFAVLMVLAFLVAFASSGRAITVSPSYTGSDDLIYLPSVSFNAGQRLYDRKIDFGNETITNTRTGRKVLFLIRNDFVFSDRFTMGFNLGAGTLDHGVLEQDTDSLDTQGDLGVGGGLRVSGVLAENLFGADWFSDFQFFSLGSDPDGARITQDDMHLSLGARRQLGNVIVEGGVQYNTSEFSLLGGSNGSDTLVEGSGEAATNLGLFVNTRVPITKLVDGFAEVKFTDEISFNLGASYYYKLGSYTPPVVRKPVSGSQVGQRPEQGENARSYVRRARRAIDREDFQMALDQLANALELDPQSPSVFFQIGRSYYLVGEFGRAEQYLRRAIELNSDVAEYHYILARVYERLNSNRRAADHYEQAVEIDPTHQRALYRLNQLDDSL